MCDQIPNVTTDVLQFINAEAGPGEGNDSSFIHMILKYLWSSDDLINRSVTGKQSNAHRNKQTKTALETHKLQFIYG